VTSSFASASAADFGIASLSTMRTLENRVRSSVNRRSIMKRALTASVGILAVTVGVETANAQSYRRYGPARTYTS